MDQPLQPITTDFGLKGRTALVTGGGSGLGRAIALALAAAGARLLLVGRREAPLAETLVAAGGDGAILADDVTAPEAPARIAAFAGAEGPATILVNAAGLNPRQPADTIGREDWEQTIALNLSAPFYIAQALVPAMKAAGYGRIINIASLQSARAFPNGIAYGASKGGITQLTRAMAEAWSPHGITANALGPGFFPTALTAPVFADQATVDRLAAQTAIGRNGTMADIAGPAVFFASPAAGYVTGQVLYVDGGFTAK